MPGRALLHEGNALRMVGLDVTVIVTTLGTVLTAGLFRLPMARAA